MRLLKSRLAAGAGQDFRAVAAHRNDRLSITPVYPFCVRAVAITSVFLSALLAFSVEPYTAKRMLPAFGGTASVWVTCLVAFQGLLLLGYLYAHALTRLSRRAQITLHLAVIAASFVVFPFRPPLPAPAEDIPLFRLLFEMARTAAFPFLVLASNSTLVQHWYARREGGQPWFLYAVSNAGSLIGLLGYPAIVEPLSGLRAQSFAWLVGYALFALATGLVLVMAAGGAPDAKPASSAPPREQTLRWFVRSALGAMLLTAVSFWVTVDVAAVPLLWVLPLALYLLTFIFAFSPRVPFPRSTLVILTMLAITLGLLNSMVSADSLELVLGPGLGAMFLGCWIVHGDLARDRPAPDRLSGYYLWIAAGGFAGGLVGNVLPPLLFDSIAEYPVALALLGLALATGTGVQPLQATLRRRSTWAILAAVLALLVMTSIGLRSEKGDGQWFHLVLVLVLVPGIVLVEKRPGLFGLSVVCIAAFLVTGNLSGNLIASERSFYGVVRVSIAKGAVVMKHGTTIHGVARRKPGDPPGAYYHPAGPLGERVLAQSDDARIGIIGLGTGALAALTKPGQKVTFYEINPDVGPLAHEHFDFLRTSPAAVDHVLGDARFTIASEPDGTFDLLIVDAFSSDDIPVHLLTQEGVAVWLRKIKPDGMVVFHVSNRYFHLLPVLRGAAEASGVRGYWKSFDATKRQRDEDLATDLLAGAMTSDSASGAQLVTAGWHPASEGDPATLWTDDYTSVLRTLPFLR